MMPVFTIETPSGQKVRIEAPDQETAVRGAQEWEAGNAQSAPKPEAMGYGEDMLRSFGSGLRSGVEAVGGMAGDINRMGGDLAQWTAGKFGASPETAERIGSGVSRMSIFAGMPGSEQVNEQTTELIGDAGTHQPQTTPGDYARTAGEFLPSAAFGTGGPLRRAAQVAIPAMTSETAGQLTEGTAAEPYARAAGALAGGAAAGAVTRPRAARLPSAQQIKDSAGYAQLREPMRQARLDGDAYRNIVRDVWNEAQDFGLTTDLRSKFGGTIRDFVQRARDSGGASLQDLELLRRSLHNAGQSSTDRAAQALSSRLVAKLDEAVDALSDSNIRSTGAGGRPTVDVLREARETWRTGVKAEMIEMATERAKNAQSGFENGLRVEFRRILNNRTLSRMFTETERESMRQVVRGTFKGNMLRLVGTFGVPMDQGRNWLGAAAGVAGGSTLGGPLGAVAIPVAGTAARAGSNAITRNNAAFTEALVKGGPNANRIVQEAMLELQAARNSGLLRTGTQMLTATQPTGQP